MIFSHFYNLITIRYFLVTHDSKKIGKSSSSLIFAPQLIIKYTYFLYIHNIVHNMHHAREDGRKSS